MGDILRRFRNKHPSVRWLWGGDANALCRRGWWCEEFVVWVGWGSWCHSLKEHVGSRQGTVARAVEEQGVDLLSILCSAWEKKGTKHGA